MSHACPECGERVAENVAHYVEAFEAMREALAEALADMARWNNLLDLEPEDQTDLHLPDLTVQEQVSAALALADKVRQ